MKILVEMTDEQYEEYRNMKQNNYEYFKKRVGDSSIDDILKVILEIKEFKCESNRFISGITERLGTRIQKWKKDSTLIVIEENEVHV